MKKILIILSVIISIISLYFIFTWDNTIQIENKNNINTIKIKLPETKEEKKEILDNLIKKETPEIYTEQEKNKQLETLKALKTKLEKTYDSLGDENTDPNSEDIMSEEELIKLLQDLNK